MIRILTLTTLLALPLSAAAETELERLERLTTQLSEKMYAHIVKEFPQAEGNLPDPSWNDETRAAAQCSVTEWRAEIGDAAVNEMLDKMEAELAKPIDDFAAWAAGNQLESPLTDEQSIAIEEKCGMAEAMTNKMMSDPKMPDLMQAMQAVMGDNG